MNEIKICEKERKKQLRVDLVIITIISFVVLAGYVLFSKQFNDFAYDTSIHIVLRVAVIGICAQFGLAGLGISVECF